MNLPSKIPKPVIRRFSLYLRQLEALQVDRVATVSSHDLAQPFGFSDAQVRKDLGYFGQFGRPGVGYEVMPLIHRLRSILGTDSVSHILLVGAGNLGKAVTIYQGFRAKGFELVAVFDNDPGLIGRRVGQLPVQPMKDLAQTTSQHDATLAIIAVPVAAAQNVADQLVAVGVNGILNFAPTRLNPLPGVSILDVDIGTELEQLNFLVNKNSPEISDQKEILIVDDSGASVVFLAQIVEDLGHRFRVARNGEEANKAIKKSRPDLVLLDLMMPRKSGISVFQEMKEDRVLRKIPIIVVTGASEITGVNLGTGTEVSKETSENDDARQLGVILHEILKGLTPDGFIEKPIEPTLLSKKIVELLS